MELQTMDLLVANLSRLNETEESDRQGVYHTLGIFENTIGFLSVPCDNPHAEDDNSQVVT